MIEYIAGRVAELTPALAVVETRGGVGYGLNISIATYEALSGKQECRLLVHEVVRDDAWILYGFATARERELFRSLIGVSGVGAATAVIMLSALPGDELAAVIAAGDVKRLKSIKGIGAKTAERIIVDLRDKLKTDATAIPATAHTESYDEALGALSMLGFDRKQSEKVLTKLFSATPTLRVEDAIKQALSLL
ncbi:MAG: Holliday junction branch migration protein RuvA [Muribaculaceae bacterium]|nr:Holliday junction branch migration protein RuvA [Muribaculaceae bacterium]